MVDRRDGRGVAADGGVSVLGLIPMGAWPSLAERGLGVLPPPLAGAPTLGGGGAGGGSGPPAPRRSSTLSTSTWMGTRCSPQRGRRPPPPMTLPSKPPPPPPSPRGRSDSGRRSLPAPPDVEPSPPPSPPPPSPPPPLPLPPPPPQAAIAAAAVPNPTPPLPVTAACRRHSQPPPPSSAVGARPASLWGCGVGGVAAHPWPRAGWATVQCVQYVLVMGGPATSTPQPRLLPLSACPPLWRSPVGCASLLWPRAGGGRPVGLFFSSLWRHGRLPWLGRIPPVRPPP